MTARSQSTGSQPDQDLWQAVLALSWSLSTASPFQTVLSAPQRTYAASPTHAWLSGNAVCEGRLVPYACLIQQTPASPTKSPLRASSTPQRQKGALQ